MKSVFDKNLFRKKMDPAGCAETYDDEFFLLSPEMFQQVGCVSEWVCE